MLKKKKVKIKIVKKCIVDNCLVNALSKLVEEKCRNKIQVDVKLIKLLKLLSSFGCGVSAFDEVVPNHQMCSALPQLTRCRGIICYMCAYLVRQDYTGVHFHALG